MFFDNNILSAAQSDNRYPQPSKVASWILARVPNVKETFYNTIPLAVINAFGEEEINKLGSNPTAKSVIRDVFKIPGTIWSAYENTEIGGTGQKYDAGNVWGALGKAVCKVTIVCSCAATKINVELASRGANYACEPIPRATALISKARQEANATDIPYKEDFFKRIDTPLVLEALGSSIPKTFASDQLGQILSDFKPSIFGNINVFDFIKLPGLILQSKVLSYFVGAHAVGVLNLKTTLWTKIDILNGNQNANIAIKFLAGAAFFFMDIALKTTSEMAISYILSPVVRIVQDGSSIAFEHIKVKLADAQFDSAHLYEFCDKVENILSKPFNAASEYFLQTPEMDGSLVKDQGSEGLQLKGEL